MIDKEKLSTKIKEILIPKLGEFVADSTVRVNCKRIGVDPEKLSSSHLFDFAAKIKVSLFLFLTEEEVSEVIQKIKNIKT